MPDKETADTQQFPDDGYFPAPSEYDPHISVAQWREILRDPELTTPDTLAMLTTMLRLGGEATCVELARLNPELRITMDASLKDVPYIKYKSKAYDKQHLANQDEVYRRADSAYVHPARLMAQLFTGTAYVRDNIASPTTLMQQLFELDGISQSSYGMPSLGFLFTPEEPKHRTERTMQPFPEGDISFLLEIPGMRSYKPIEQLGPEAQPSGIRINKGDDGLRIKLWLDFR